MAWEIGYPALKLSRVANSDLRLKQYCFVKLVSGGDGDLIDVCSGVTDRPIGVLQNKPRAGEEAEIMQAGVTKIVGGAALTLGALIGPDTAGAAIAEVPGTDTTHYVCGTILAAPLAQGNVGTASIDCQNPSRAA